MDFDKKYIPRLEYDYFAIFHKNKYHVYNMIFLGSSFQYK